jgi:TrmH family RNA methyltransferase
MIMSEEKPYSEAVDTGRIRICIIKHMERWKDNVSFVLVEPVESGNIGASARAIKNMGFASLCLVRPPEVITEEAGWFAHNADDVLGSARTFNSLNGALEDKSLIVGITRRKGKKRGLVLPVDEGMARVAEIACNNRVAILFGREQQGLHNHETDECGFLVSIPAGGQQPSLNLSHAVMIIAYELAKMDFRGRRTDDVPGLATYAEREMLYERMLGILELLDYTQRGRNIGRGVLVMIKRFLGRSRLTLGELKMLHGICERIHTRLKNNPLR